MNYILMHRKTAVAEIEMNDSTAAITKVKSVLAPEHLPVGIIAKNNILDKRNLNEWWQGRSIPASRQNIQSALERMGFSSPFELLTKSFGLSLSDQYWINPTDNPLNWEEINFFDNAFSEDVGNILFGNDDCDNDGGLNLDLVSPNNTCDGWLMKKWKVIEGKHYLIKGGSSPYQQEPFNEVVASAIMNRLNINHTPYSLIIEDGKPYSLCENFITSKTDLVSAWYVAQSLKKPNSSSRYQHFIDCCSYLGLSDVQNSLDKMLTVDYLINNEDRHYNNFGIIRDAESLKIIGFAPVYDSGTSLRYEVPTERIYGYDKIECKPFRKTHEEQIKLVKDFSWLDLSNLADIDEEIHEIFSRFGVIEPDRNDRLCRAVMQRIRMLDKHIQSVMPVARK